MYTFPAMTRRTLPNGLQVLWVPDREQRTMTIALQIPVGEFSDPPSFEGTAELTVALMQKGTQALSSEEFAEKLEQTGATIFSETGDEHLVLGCKMLSMHMETVAPMFWDMVCSPRFDEGELTRLKREMITGLQAEIADPNALVNKHFFTVLCTNKHPAGRVHSIASIKRIGLREIRSFYTSYFSPEKSVLAIAGHLVQQEAEDRWTPVFSGWSASRPKESCIGEPLTPLKRTVIRLVDKPDITQTYFIIGHPVPGELSPQRNACALANYILGGGNFSSRLMERVRSEKGKTYGISSQIMSNRECGIFMIATATLCAQTAEVLGAILDVYREFSTRGITEAELAKAKEFAIGNMAFQLEGIGNIVEKLLWLSLFDRPLSYIEHFDSLIASIGVDTVNEAIRSHLSSAAFTIAAVGPKTQIQSQLSAMGEVSTVHFRETP
ncbi:MAG TPA: pitrilysin family protein [Chitinivibrionales bacterium]